MRHLRSVEPFHLFRYLDEPAYRDNERYSTDGDRFTQAIRRVVGRRLGYQNLIGKLSRGPASAATTAA